MLLTVDRGNTSLDVMAHGSQARRWRARADAADPILAVLADLAPATERVVASTVVPGGLAAVAELLAARAVRLEVAGVDLPCPLALAYRTPATLGSDRWLCALAAHRGFGAALVVQCGTAVTVDAVDAEGRFLGGAIAPGLRAMARGLAAAAPGLPQPAAFTSTSLPADSSLGCVEAGVLLAFCGAVERLVGDLASALPASSARLLTGGDAETYLTHGRLRLTHVDDLLHRGLVCLARTSAPGS